MVPPTSERGYPMRPWHEVARLVGLEEGAGVPEPTACNPLALAHLGRARLLVEGATLEDAHQTMETFCREENVKPAVLMMACREVEIGQVGQPEIWHGRRLISSGRVGSDGSIVFRFHGSRPENVIHYTQVKGETMGGAE